MNPDHLAKEADRLKHDPIFIKALEDMRADALDALAQADADNTTMIIRLQQNVAVIDGLQGQLSHYILSAGYQPQDQNSPYV
jgi:hypothetical protein